MQPARNNEELGGGTRESRWDTWGNYHLDGPYNASIRVMAAAARLRFEPDSAECVREATGAATAAENSSSANNERTAARTGKRCSRTGCTNLVVRGGVCFRHGAKSKAKRCSREGCANIAQKGGLCIRHGAKVRRCSHPGCTNQVIKGGVCKRHGAKIKR